MKASEVISAKIQTLLGSNYHIFSNTYFNKNYTEAREVREGENIGYARYTTAEYGKFRKNKVVGIFTITSSTRSNSNIYYLSGGYKIEFSVPRNVIKKTKYDEVISAPTYNFDTDIEALIDAITNANISYVVGTGQTARTYNGRLTMSEPTYLMTESDGEYQYDIMTISGNFVISDKAKFGKQYKIELGIGNYYVELDDITSFTESINNDGNAIVKENKTRIEQNLGQSGWVCTATIDDYESSNLARQRIYSIVHENKEIVNSSAVNNALKRKQRVKITTPHGHTHIFNAIMTVAFTTSENGVGSYAISFTDDNKDVLAHTLFFNSAGGSDVVSKSVREGSEIGSLTTPTKTGYTFVKWQIDGVDITASTIYEYLNDKTATAVWQANEYKVYFNANGGTGDTFYQTMTYDTASDLSANTFTHINSGYQAYFRGWSLDSGAITPTFTDEQEVINISTGADVTLYAVWENYELSFNSNGGSYVTSKHIVYGDEIGTLETPTYQTYDFLGWYIGATHITSSTRYTYREDKEASAGWDIPDYAEVWLFNEVPSAFTDKTFSESYYYYYEGQKTQCSNIEFTTYSGGQNSIFFNSTYHTGGYIGLEGQGWIDGNTTAHRTLYFANPIDTTGGSNTLGYWLIRNATKVD